MRRIYKYRLSAFEPYVELPVGARPLSVQIQHRAFTLWAEVETDNPTELVTIYRVPTGSNAPESATYISTVQDDCFVWHFYLGSR